jgi:hypothetical protein
LQRDRAALAAWRRRAKTKTKIKLTVAHRGLRHTCTHWDYCSASHSAPSWLLTCSLTQSDH